MVERSVRGARASVAWTEVQFKDEHDLTESFILWRCTVVYTRMTFFGDVTERLYCAPVRSICGGTKDQNSIINTGQNKTKEYGAVTL